MGELECLSPSWPAWVALWMCFLTVICFSTSPSPVNTYTLRFSSCELLDCDVEDILWVKLSNVASGVDVVLAVCYIPPISSGREVRLEERWQCLSEQVSKYASLGTVLLCGDFNARCGCVEEVEGLGDREAEEQVINEQGRVCGQWQS